MKGKKVIVFDFDGTLADSKKAYVETIYHTLMLHSYIYSKNRIIKALGPKLEDSLKNLARFPPNEIKKIKNEINHKILMLAKSLKPCPYVKNTLKRIHKKGNHLILLTNSARKFCFVFLKHNNLLNYFEKRFYAENFSDKEHVIRNLAKEYRIPVKEIVYVGDRMKDVNTARKSGCKIIISLSCSWDKPKVRGKIYTIKDFSQLEARL